LRRSARTALILSTLILLLSTSALGADSPQKDELLFGLIPEENIFKQMKRHAPLAKYLSDELGIPVRFTILSRYPHIITRFVSRGLDGAFFGAFTGILAEEMLNVEPIARPVNIDGEMTTRSYIFKKRTTPGLMLHSMRGASIAFVDVASATGYLFALDILKRNGISNYKSFFKDELFTGGHDTAVYTVLAGNAQVGIAKARIVEKLMETDPLVKEEIKVLHKSPPLPDNTLFVKSDLPQMLKLKLKNVLLSMHKSAKGQKALNEFEALQFTLADSDDFKTVRSMTKRVGIDLNNFEYSK